MVSLSVQRLFGGFVQLRDGTAPAQVAAVGRMSFQISASSDGGGGPALRFRGPANVRELSHSEWAHGAEGTTAEASVPFP